MEILSYLNLLVEDNIYFYYIGAFSLKKKEREREKFSTVSKNKNVSKWNFLTDVFMIIFDYFSTTLFRARRFI